MRNRTDPFFLDDPNGQPGSCKNNPTCPFNGFEDQDEMESTVNKQGQVGISQQEGGSKAYRQGSSSNANEGNMDPWVKGGSGSRTRTARFDAHTLFLLVEGRRKDF